MWLCIGVVRFLSDKMWILNRIKLWKIRENPSRVVARLSPLLFVPSYWQCGIRMGVCGGAQAHHLGGWTACHVSLLSPWHHMWWPGVAGRTCGHRGWCRCDGDGVGGGLTCVSLLSSGLFSSSPSYLLSSPLFSPPPPWSLASHVVQDSQLAVDHGCVRHQPKGWWWDDGAGGSWWK